MKALWKAMPAAKLKDVCALEYWGDVVDEHLSHIVPQGSLHPVCYQPISSNRGCFAALSAIFDHNGSPQNSKNHRANISDHRRLQVTLLWVNGLDGSVSFISSLNYRNTLTSSSLGRCLIQVYCRVG